jgi:endonuclease/exonuclease/phosphatase family metal-dependent hydrolase
MTTRRNNPRSKRTRKNVNARKKQRNRKQRGGEGDLPIKVMTYNVLARDATRFQSEFHQFRFNNYSNMYYDCKDLNKQPHFAINDETARIVSKNDKEHIEQTIKRYELIKREIEEKNPDIILLQEVDFTFFSYILKHLKQYRGFFKILIWDKDANASTSFGTAIMWNADKFECKHGNTIDTTSADTEYTSKCISNGNKKDPFQGKNATVVRLTHTVSQKQVTAVSVHLPGDSSSGYPSNSTRELIVDKIVKEVESDAQVIIGGDLNCPLFSQQNECFTKILEKLTNTYDRLSFLNQPMTNTTCSFDYAPKGGNKNELIDTIFFKGFRQDGEVQVQKIKCNSTEPEGTVYLKDETVGGGDEPNNKYGPAPYTDPVNGSDHAWVMATLTPI